MTTFTFKCLPPNEPFRTVDITAATLAEATQRANALWCHQTRPPELVGTREEVTLPNGCTVETAQRRLNLYDARCQGGYKNQQIAARQQLHVATGMNVRELRAWLTENAA